MRHSQKKKKNQTSIFCCRKFGWKWAPRNIRHRIDPIDLGQQNPAPLAVPLYLFFFLFFLFFFSSKAENIVSYLSSKKKKKPKSEVLSMISKGWLGGSHSDTCHRPNGEPVDKHERIVRTAWNTLTNTCPSTCWQIWKLCFVAIIWRGFCVPN